uniref:Bud site selection protein 6 n=1 Tax=Lygus hesperus TaxID=30085 RepID=A0A0A9W131_LYGHE
MNKHLTQNKESVDNIVDQQKQRQMIDTDMHECNVNNSSTYHDTKPCLVHTTATNSNSSNNGNNSAHRGTNSFSFRVTSDNVSVNHGQTVRARSPPPLFPRAENVVQNVVTSTTDTKNLSV